MRQAYRVETVRAAERALMATLPEGTLMRRAAGGLAATCAGLLERRPGQCYGARVVVLAGSGDNGGDALYAGATLARRGATVTAVAPGTKVHEGGAAALRAAGGRVLTGTPSTEGPSTGGLSTDPLVGAHLILDGMLGIGGRGGLREPYAGLAVAAERARRENATVVAVDLPSGIDADTGTVAGPAIVADVTVTFGVIKPGLLIDPGASHAGTVQLVDIGLGPYLGQGPAACAPQLADIRALLPRPGAESDKYRRGVVGLLAGSDRFTGAAVLATGGAIHGGAGMVRVVTEATAAQVVRQEWPEAVITVQQEGDDPTAAGRVQAWVAGPGMGTNDAAGERLAAVLGTGVPVLVDADGLTLLARLKGGPRSAGPAGPVDRDAPTLITPHAGELGRLLGAEPADIEAHRLDYARRGADELGVTVLLKGSTTVIADPGEDPVLVNPTGTPWLATAGSGDVLSGLAGALLAQGLPSAQAGIAAAYLHGLAARLAAAGPATGYTPHNAPRDVTSAAPIGASDVVAALPDAFRAVS
ncbi:MAG TPA: NAD(P)H-hydrate dehydratase [Streptosporangiaceae bacterium]